MTQEELQARIENVRVNHTGDALTEALLELINQHVAEVIGEDDETNAHSDNHIVLLLNRFRADQRKRAGL